MIHLHPPLPTQRSIVNVSGKKVVDEGPWDTAKAAAYIDSTELTLRTWRSQGRGPVFYRGPGRKISYRRSDLDVWRTPTRIEPAESRSTPGNSPTSDRSTAGSGVEPGAPRSISGNEPTIIRTAVECR